MSQGWITVMLSVAGIAGTLVAAVAGQRSAAKLTRMTLDHQTAMAMNDRRQRRLEDAYLKTLRLVEASFLWTLTVARRGILIGEPVPQKLPGAGAQRQVNVLLSAFGSPEVRRLFAVWVEALNAIVYAVGDLEGDRAEPLETRPDLSPQYRRIYDELRPAEENARHALQDRVSVELTGRSTSVANPPEQRGPARLESITGADGG